MDSAASPSRFASSPRFALLLVAVGIHFAAMLVAWRYPPSLNSDSATGFLVWDAWQKGADWNHMITADPENIAHDVTVFQAWWSPGQYVIVAPWQWTGLSLGHAIAVGGFCITTIGLVGYWLLFRIFGFSAATCGWVVLAAACNWTLTRTYGDYLGGEPALLGLLPWLVLATAWSVESGWLAWLALPVLYWIGNMAKNSYIPMGAGLIAGLRGSRLWGRPYFSSSKVTELGRWVGWLALGHLLLWWSYLRLGANPGISRIGEHPLWWQATAELVGFPLSSVFSLGNILGRLFLFPAHPRLTGPEALWPIHVLVAVLAIYLQIILFRREFQLRSRYAWLLSGVIASYTAFFGLILLLRAAPGWEERMFKPIGFLLLPAIIEIIRTARFRPLAWCLGGALAASSLYGVAALANRAHSIAALANVGRRGVTQHVLSREALAILQQLDASLPRDSLIVVPSPEMALEVNRVRVTPTHAIMSTVGTLESGVYHGRASVLIVLVNDTMLATGQAQALLKSFRDYPSDGWKVHTYGPWYFFQQGTFTDWPDPTVQLSAGKP